MDCDRCGQPVGGASGGYSVFAGGVAVHEHCLSYAGGQGWGRAYGPGRPQDGEPVTETAKPPSEPANIIEPEGDEA